MNESLKIEINFYQFNKDELEKRINKVKFEFYNRLLEMHRFNVDRAARFCGVDHQTLRRQLKRLGIDYREAAKSYE